PTASSPVEYNSGASYYNNHNTTTTTSTTTIASWCVQGEETEGGTCLCRPCWSGPRCQTYVDDYAPRFLFHAATAVVPQNITGEEQNGCKRWRREGGGKGRWREGKVEGREGNVEGREGGGRGKVEGREGGGRGKVEGEGRWREREGGGKGREGKVEGEGRWREGKVEGREGGGKGRWREREGKVEGEGRWRESEGGGRGKVEGEGRWREGKVEGREGKGRWREREGGGKGRWRDEKPNPANTNIKYQILPTPYLPTVYSQPLVIPANTETNSCQHQHNLPTLFPVISNSCQH
ncbi:hypothetical protein Pmani_038097, partial [Petrolisthes manimaculis]